MNWQQSFIVVFLPYEISTSKLINKFHQLFLSANLWYLSLIVRTKHANDDHNNNNDNNNNNIFFIYLFKNIKPTPFTRINTNKKM